MRKRKLLFAILAVCVIFILAYTSASFLMKNKLINNFELIQGESTAIDRTSSPLDSFNKDRKVVMDFSDCARGRDSMFFAFGHISFAFEGVEDGKCIFYFGGEIENPNWDGKLNNRCIVPTFIGKKEFIVKQMGIDWGNFYQEFCRVFQ